MTRARPAFVLLLGLIALAGTFPASARQQAKSALELLGGASSAVRHENYRGVLVYLRGGQLDTLRVVHRFHNKDEQERLLSLTGPPREVIRSQGEVTSILPSHKVVLISLHPPKSLLGSMAQFSTSRLQAHYKIIDEGEQRFAGRSCRAIHIVPKDRYRYGYNMLVDENTNLPLKLDLVQNDAVLEQLMFTEISFPKKIPDKDFISSYDVHGFRVIRHQVVHVHDDKGKVPESGWHAQDLPPGFSLAEDGVRQVAKNAFVRQMLFTDGVATVSAFIAPAGLRKPLKGATRMGAVNAYGDIVGDTQITVVGEVPAVTAKRIAENIVDQSHQSSSQQHKTH